MALPGLQIDCETLTQCRYKVTTASILQDFDPITNLTARRMHLSEPFGDNVSLGTDFQ